jgi:hypothetical protein
MLQNFTIFSVDWCYIKCYWWQKYYASNTYVLKQNVEEKKMSQNGKEGHISAYEASTAGRLLQYEVIKHDETADWV